MMRRVFYVLVLLLVGIVSGFAHQPEFSTAGFFELSGCGRKVFSMNPAWRFHKGDAEGAEAWEFDDSRWEVVSLPHGIEYLPLEASGCVNYQGEVWYRKHFSPDSRLKGKKLFLHFEAIMGKSKVFVNGKQVAEHYGGGAHLQAVGRGFGCRHDVLQAAYLVVKLVPRVNIRTADGEQLVALDNACLLRRRAGQHAVDLGGNERTGENRLLLHHREQAHVLGHGKRYFLAVAQNGYRMCVGYGTVHVNLKPVERLLVGAQQYVAVAETYFLGRIVELHTHRHVL